MERIRWGWLFVFVLLGASFAARADAKVAFTGYGDFEFVPESRFSIDGPPSLLAPFGISPGDFNSRGTNINSIGLFATSSLSDNTRLMLDVTYLNIGADVKTTRIQYGYAEYSDELNQLQAGKITLPFGYYNQNRFYPFQRPSISAPTFQSAILGLPIADLGADAARSFDAGPAVVRLDAYVVNGYGSVPGSTTTFRSPSLPGGLTIVENIGSANKNDRVAVGGRADFSLKDRKDSSAGVSYYWDEWDPNGRHLFQMGNAYLHARAAGFDLLTEYLYLEADGDAGFAVNLGSTHWRTDGFFVELQHLPIQAFGKPVTPWARFEDYYSREYFGSASPENLWDAAGGVSVQVLDGLAAKLEVNDLYYRLPYVGVGDLTLKGFSVDLGMTVTF